MKGIAPKQIMALLCLIAGMAGCGKQESAPNQAAAPAQPQATQKPAERVGYPPGDVRWRFVAKDQPLLDEGAQVKLWAGSQKKDKPEILVKELDYPTLEYAPDGTLYFIGDHRDAIVAIKPDQSSEVIARSGTHAGAKTDDGEPVYITFEGLSFTDKGNLLTMKYGAAPYQISLETRRLTYLDMVLPTGEVISKEDDQGYPNLKNYLSWQFQTILADSDWIILYNQPNKTWYRYKKGEMLEKIDNPEHLKNPDVYLRVTDQYGITGPDGYIYAVEQGQGKQAPDRIIRIGDPGLSSLRKDASRVTIAEFKHGELTGSIAFSPKGELAVGAKNRIYLITPGPVGQSQPEKAP